MIVKPGVGIIPPRPVIGTRRNFPDFLAAYREYTSEHEATAKVHHWTGVSLLAAALERKVFLDRGYYKVFPNLYMFIIGAPGLVKKSTSTAIGVDLLRELPTINMTAESLTRPVLIDNLARAQSEYEYKGEKCKQSAIYCYASELTVFMEEIAGNITDLLTTFYDCSPQDWKKPWVYETRGQGEVRVHGPCVNFLGCSTPTWLKRVVPIEAMEGGFASRILFVIEEERPEIVRAIPKISPELQAMKPKLVEDLFIINSLVGEFKMTPSAEEKFVSWYEDHMNFIHNRRGDTRFAGYYGRKATMVEKLSMVASVSESNSLIVDLPHVLKAIAWIEQLERGMFQGFAISGRNPLSGPARSVLTYIQAKRAVSEADLTIRFFTELDSEALKKIVEQLKMMQQIQISYSPSGIVYTIMKDAPDIMNPDSGAQKTDAPAAEVEVLEPEVENLEEIPEWDMGTRLR